MKKRAIINILSGSLLATVFCLFLSFVNTYAANGTYVYEVNYTYEGDTLTISPYTTYDGRKMFNVREIPEEVRWFTDNKNDVRKIVIEDGIENINKNAFKDFVNLEEVIFPKNMPGQISDYAFSGAPKLKKVTIPDGLIRIGNYAFYGTGITKVEIPIYTDWLGEHAFPDGTEIIMLKEKEDIMAAGTAGWPHGYYNDNTIHGEGKPSNNTCYNKASVNGGWYTATAFWRLYNDGTLVVWGTDLAPGYLSSRVPWGCYKDHIKKIIFNDDKTGKLTKKNKVGNRESLPNAKYAIYASKPVDEIMENRIKVIEGAQTWDCRFDCTQGFRNVESIVFNRGIESIPQTSTFHNSGAGESLKDVYLSKYVKSANMGSYWYEWNIASHDGSTDYVFPRLHIEASFDDYKNNGYNYRGRNDSELVTDEGFKDKIGEPSFTYPYGSEEIFSAKLFATIENNIDKYYVSVNDASAPDTITHNDKTLYKYETYITKDDGSVDVSLPNMEDVEYYVKEITAPEGFQVDPTVYKVDMSGKNIDIQMTNYPVGYKEAEPKQPKTEKNPNTATATPAVYFVLFGAMAATVVLVGRRISKLAK